MRASTVAVVMGVIACGGSSGGDNDSTATPVPTEPSLDQLLNDYKTSVVDIEVTGADGAGGGTGIVWEDSHQVLTNAHVVLGAATIKVKDPVEQGKEYSAVVVGLSACDDVALLRVERAENLTPARFGDSKQATAGTPVIAMGFPGTYASSETGSSLVVTEGIVSRTGATFADSGQKDLIQHTAPINPGNSGGPLLNKQGEVIGLNSYTIRGAQAENYAISTSEATYVADKLKEGKNLDYLGINVVTNNEDLAESQDLPFTDGLAVLSTSAGSPATKAAPYTIEPGYTIGFIDGQFIQDVGTYCDVLRSHKPGDTVSVEFGAWDSDNTAQIFETELTIE
jgi:S1-C subfamily serine protease